jgi:hypothetical protein
MTTFSWSITIVAKVVGVETRGVPAGAVSWMVWAFVGASVGELKQAGGGAAMGDNVRVDGLS